MKHAHVGAGKNTKSVVDEAIKYFLFTGFCDVFTFANVYLTHTKIP